MIDLEELNEIIEKITDTYEEPVPIGGRCESHVYYRVQDLNDHDLDVCAEYVAERIRNVVAPQTPQLFLKLPGGYTFFAERLCTIYSELYGKGSEVPLEQYLESKMSNGHGDKYRGYNTILFAYADWNHGRQICAVEDSRRFAARFSQLAIFGAP